MSRSSTSRLCCLVFFSKIWVCLLLGYFLPKIRAEQCRVVGAAGKMQYQHNSNSRDGCEVTCSQKRQGPNVRCEYGSWIIHDHPQGKGPEKNCKVTGRGGRKHFGRSIRLYDCRRQCNHNFQANLYRKCTWDEKLLRDHPKEDGSINAISNSIRNSFQQYIDKKRSLTYLVFQKHSLATN